MMYNNKLVAVIKVGNKVLREQGDTVYIPFGSEYSIHFKNLNIVDAVVDITIDGEDVLDGDSLVVRKNNEANVEGFLKGSNVTHKFKFIEKTGKISDYRGDKLGDGLVRISYKFEKPKNMYSYPYYGGSYGPRGIGNDLYGNSTGSPLRGSYQTYSSNLSTNDVFSSSTNINDFIDVDDNDEGITVKGSASDQSFQNVSVGALESTEHVIVFHLKGSTKSGIVEKPVHTKTKLKCDTCGDSNISKNKFCGGCGTSLVM